MSAKKKKKRPEVAQQLIDSLLDEKTPTDGVVVQVTFSNHPNEISADDDDNDYENDEPIELALEGMPSKKSPPPFEGSKPLVTRMAEQMPEVDNEFSLGDIDMSRPQQNARPDAKVERPAPSPVVDPDNEPTVRLQSSPKDEPKSDETYDVTSSLNSDQAMPISEPANPRKKISAPVNPYANTEIRTGFQPQNQAKQNASPAFSSTAAALKQSDNLRIAQQRLSEMEAELEKLRRENEQLASAGDTLRRRTDELLSRAESVENQARESKRNFEEEKKVLRGQIQGKERENIELRSRLEEIETRLESGFKKIRVRERELEHRLEIVKMESATLVSTKDRMILELKRQVDQLNHDADHGKQKSQELFNQYKEKQETIRRVVRALRIALTILEGDEDAVVPLKKAD